MKRLMRALRYEMPTTAGSLLAWIVVVLVLNFALNNASAWVVVPAALAVCWITTWLLNRHSGGAS